MGLQPFWTIQNKKESNFKIADQIHYKGIYLPINADLNEEDILFVCEKFKKLLKFTNKNYKNYLFFFISNISINIFYCTYVHFLYQH